MQIQKGKVKFENRFTRKLSFNPIKMEWRWKEKVLQTEKKKKKRVFPLAFERKAKKNTMCVHD